MIYFLRRDNGDIKIGFTDDYHLRLSQLTEQHGDLELLGLMSGGRDEERELHKHFSWIRRWRTEWFAPHDELKLFISNNTHLNLPERKQRHLSSRLPCKSDTHDRLKEFCLGLGATMDEGLNFIFDKIIGDEEPLVAGRRLRDVIKQGKQSVTAKE